jgi:hypothetical protein
MHEKSPQISCPFWNFPGIEACVDHLISLLACWKHCVSLDGFLLSSFCSPCYEVMGQAWNAFYCCSEIVLCQLSMQFHFPAYLLQGKDHYNEG